MLEGKYSVSEPCFELGFDAGDLQLPLPEFQHIAAGDGISCGVVDPELRPRQFLIFIFTLGWRLF